MTALATVRAQLAAAIQEQVPAVQVSSVPLGEATALRESIWIERMESEFEWRSLGAGASFAHRNRTERVVVDLRVHVYREARDHTEAADDAFDRAEELLAEIEDALEADFTIGDAVTHALVTRWSVDLQPRDSGWAVLGRATVEATNYP